MEITLSLDQVEIMALEMDPPIVLDESTLVADVIGRMRQRRGSSAVLTRNGTLAGIFTERDVLHKVLGVAGATERAVSEFMTPNPTFISSRDPIRSAIVQMYRGGYRSVPVVDADNHVVACVGERDLGEYLVQHFADFLLNRPPEPEKIATSREGG